MTGESAASMSSTSSHRSVKACMVRCTKPGTGKQVSALSLNFVCHKMFDVLLELLLECH